MSKHGEGDTPAGIAMERRSTSTSRRAGCCTPTALASRMRRNRIWQLSSPGPPTRPSHWSCATRTEHAASSRRARRRTRPDCYESVRRRSSAVSTSERTNRRWRPSLSEGICRGGRVFDRRPLHMHEGCDLLGGHQLGEQGVAHRSRSQLRSCRRACASAAACRARWIRLIPGGRAGALRIVALIQISHRATGVDRDRCGTGSLQVRG